MHNRPIIIIITITVKSALTTVTVAFPAVTLCPSNRPRPAPVRPPQPNVYSPCCPWKVVITQYCGLGGRLGVGGKETRALVLMILLHLSTP